MIGYANTAIFRPIGWIVKIDNGAKCTADEARNEEVELRFDLVVCGDQAKLYQIGD